MHLIDRPVSAVATELFAAPARAALGESQVLSHPDWVETADIRPWLDSDDSAADRSGILCSISNSKTAKGLVQLRFHQLILIAHFLMDSTLFFRP